MNKICSRNNQRRKKTFVNVALTAMRIFVLLITVGLSSVYANSTYAQIKLDINVNNVSIEDLFKEVESNSEYVFFYKDELIDKTVKISLNLKDALLRKILNQSFSNTDLDYEIIGRQVVIKKKQSANNITTTKNVQQLAITGVIYNENGMPLPGASIIEKGTQNGTQSDFDGQFSLVVKNTDAILIITYIGYISQEIPVGNQKNINITLAESVEGLEEIVVIGYGSRSKKDVMSAISSVKPEEVTKVVSTDLGEMLRGKAPGVQVTLNSAAPGSSSNILIRGNRSIGGQLGAGNGALIIVDGITVGDINSINPADIDSIDILKDAAAQAIYGARASNGVILITTKRGTSGKPKISFSSLYGIQEIIPNFDVFTPQEYIQLKREAFRTINGGEFIPDEEVFGPLELESIASGNFINWRDQLLGSAPIQNHTVSLSSGTENSQIYLSANFRAQEGVIPNTNFKEGNFRLNVSQTINDWLRIGVNSSAQISERNNPDVDDILRRVVIASPLGQIYNEDGSLRLYPNGFQDLTNPLIDVFETSQVTQDRNDLIHLYADVSPFKNFNYRVNISRRSYNNSRESYETALSAAGAANGFLGEGSARYRRFSEWQLENVFTYSLKKGKSNFDFTAVQSIIENNFSGFNLNADNTANDVLGFYGLDIAEVLNPSFSNNRRRFLSFVGRVEYNYARKYYMTVSARSDGASVFGSNNKWGYFPALSAGWNIDEENFLKESNVINTLKLRTSYGSVGNADIIPYTSIATGNLLPYVFQDDVLIGYSPGGTLSNPDLKWETSTTTNVGLDFGLWNNRLSGTFEFYNISTTDLLIRQSIEASTGYDDRWNNIGEVQNRGVEINMNGVIIDNDDLKIQLGFNYTRNRNKIIELYGDGEDDIANRFFIGQPINVYFTQLYDRIWQENDDIENSYMPDAQPGDIKVKDKNNDGVLDEEDQYIISRDPDWFGTFSLRANYKGIDLSADVITVQGVTRLNQYLNNYNFGGTLRGDRNQIAVDYWTPENPGGYYPRPREGNDPANVITLGYEDASFVRLQNLTLGYTLPNSILSKLKLSNFRLYITGQNLFTWTDFLSYSPEQTPENYPEARIISTGIQVNF